MKVSGSKRRFTEVLSAKGLKPSALTPQQGISAMLDFYSSQRAAGCSLEEDGDMLLFQWGTYDWGEGEVFEVDVTRQFITGSDGDDDIFQLSFTFRFKPTDAFRKLKDGNKWCHTPEGLNEFRAFIHSSRAYKITATLKADQVELDFSGV